MKTDVNDIMLKVGLMINLINFYTVLTQEEIYQINQNEYTHY